MIFDQKGFGVQKWLDIEEAAKYLGVGTRKLYDLAAQGRIPGSKLAAGWRFDREDLDVWVKANAPIETFFLGAPAQIESNDLLREPQREAYHAVRDYLDHGGDHCVVQLPVGCGKTGLVAILPFGVAAGRVLVIAPNLTIRSELARNLDVSNRGNFWSKCGVLQRNELSAGPFLTILDGANANIHDCDKSHIVLTNIQQLNSVGDRWLPQFSDDFFDLILVDEGHHNAATSWQRVFEKFPKARVVSLTATPFRSDRQDVDGELVYRYPFRRAMIRGYIKTLRAVYVSPEVIEFTYKGERRTHSLEDVLALKEEEWFSRGVALSDACNEHVVDNSLSRLEELRRTGTQHQLIAVACSVRHAEQVCALYQERGFEAAVVHSGLDDDAQQDVLRRLRAGLLDCIVQVQMLGEGFDHPPLSVAAIFRPFRSLAPYIQFVGRILRATVQNAPGHADNRGYVVSHVGMNTDTLYEDLRQLDRDDATFMELLLAGEEVVPPEVTRGDARLKLTPDMVVAQEIVDGFLEQDFFDPTDELVLQEIARQAELLGLDAEMVVNALRAQAGDKMRRRPADEPYIVLPQRRRQTAKDRLGKEVRSSASVVLNRLDVTKQGMDIPLRGGVAAANNYAAAVMMMNRQLNELVGIVGQKRSELPLETIEAALAAVPEAGERVFRQLTMKLNERGGKDAEG